MKEGHMRYQYFLILFMSVYCVFMGLVPNAKAENNLSTYSAREVTEFALDVFFDYCLKTYGEGQDKMAQGVDKNLSGFVRDELLPAEIQSTFYQKESNYLWLMRTPIPTRKIRMGFKKSSECFVGANDIDQAQLIAGFRARTPDRNGSIFQGVIVHSDFAFSGLQNEEDVRRGSYEVYKKSPYAPLYTVSVTIIKDNISGLSNALFYMQPDASPAQE